MSVDLDLDHLRRSVVRGELDPSALLSHVCDLTEYVVTASGTFHLVDDNGRPECGVRTMFARCWADLVRSYRVCRNCTEIRGCSR